MIRRFLFTPEFIIPIESIKYVEYQAIITVHTDTHSFKISSKGYNIPEGYGFNHSGYVYQDIQRQLIGNA